MQQISIVREDEIKAQLRTWIVEKSKQPVVDTELDYDTAVIDSGFLSSLDVVEFVLYIESLLGDEIDLEDLEPEVFTSINTMYEAFFAQAVCG